MTAQVPENLTYMGKQHEMCDEPLADYFELASVEPPFVGLNSACWRGYIGTWEIKDDRLYLIELEGRIGSGEANLETLFPGFPERVFAHWYTGTVRLPHGKLLDYVHGGYASRYERDLFIEFERGLVKKTHFRENGVSDDPDAPEGYSIAASTTFG